MLAHDKIFKLALLALGKAQQLHRNSYIFGVYHMPA